MGCSPLITFVLFLFDGLQVRWLADTLLFRSPITISAGCRLILSVQEATSQRFTLGSDPAMLSSFVAQDEPWQDDTYVA